MYLDSAPQLLSMPRHGEVYLHVDFESLLGLMIKIMHHHTTYVLVVQRTDHKVILGSQLGEQDWYH